MSKVRWLLSLALVVSLGVQAYAQEEELEEEEEVTEAAEPAPSQSSSAAEAAGAAYDKGDCEAATSAYRALRESPQVSADERDLATFRIGYCAYNAGDLDVAVSEFQALLLRRPDEDEARLRLAECQLSQEEFREAAENAAKVTDETLLPQAKVVAARAHLELQQAGKALGALNAAFGKDQSLDPVIEFWRGLAYFQLFNESSAEKAFRRSLKTSPNGWWTRTASINWLKTVRDSRRLIHARLGISYGSDDNIGQMTYRDSRTSAPNKSYYVADTYKSFDATLSTKALRTGKVGWVPSITAGGQYYTKSDNKGYNPFTVTGDLTATYAQSYRWTYRGSVYYSDLKYDNEAYQQYLGTNLSLLHALTKRTTIHFGLGGSKISGSSPGYTYGPTLGAEGETSSFYWLANASYTGATGEKAKFVTSLGSTSLSSGAIGSTYSTKSLKAGIGRVLFWELDLLGQVTYAKTDYAREDVPATAAYSTTARADTSLSGQVTLSKTLIERRMTFTASYVYTKVDSQGFQGLSYSSGSSPDYNVTRSIVSGYLSYGF